MLKYRTIEWNEKIEAVEVERETEASVWVAGRREFKRTSYHNYFDTWGAARQHNIDKAHRVLDGMKRRVENAQEKLNKAIAIPRDAPKGES